VLLADLSASPGSLPGRAVIGAVIALGIAIVARRGGSLSTSGAAAAVVVGTICAAAGVSWAILVIAFFMSSTALGRIRADVRTRRIGSVVAKGGRRDASQVLANGGVFAVAALGQLLHPSPGWLALGGGALAAAAADTWGTEIGSLSAHSPRDILRWRPVAPGTSGGVTAVGTLASVGGGAFIAALAALAGWPWPTVFATFVGGVAGAFADSILGAAVQVRRWCDRCNSATEQPVHLCGSPTRIAGGVPWVDNDTVNLLSVLLGGAIGFALYATLTP
jgi:uncharacterized protein (TIGR00297 family)